MSKYCYNGLAKFLEEIPPYVNVEISIKDLYELRGLDKSRLAIESFCLECKKEKTFERVFIADIDLDYRKLAAYLICLSPSPDHDEEAGIDFSLFWKLEFSCSKCNMSLVYVLRLTNDSIMKIGQYPSYAMIQHTEIEKYRNVISKYYLEFKQSLSAYSQNMGVASFVYLRRILEDIINKKYKSEFSENPQDIRFIDKLKQIETREKIIPSEFDDVRTKIYSVLSKGVHEYQEEECLVLYPYVRFVIESILDKLVEEKERKKKIAIVTGEISAKLEERPDSD